MSYTYGTAPRFENQRGDLPSGSKPRNNLHRALSPSLDWRYSLISAIFFVVPALIAM